MKQIAEIPIETNTCKKNCSCQKRKRKIEGVENSNNFLRESQIYKKKI